MKHVMTSDATLIREEGTFSFKESIEIARQLEKLKVDIIEMPKIENARKDTLLVKTVSAFVKSGIISVIAGATNEEIDQAALALASAEHPRLCVSMPISDVGMEYGYHKKGPAMVKLIGELCAYAKSKCADVEFCAVDATRADKRILADAIKCAVDNGASTVTICDNEGVMLPDDFCTFVDSAIEASGIGDDINVGVWCANTNGMAAANSVMAIKGKANVIKTAVCSGIASLSTIIDIFKNCGNNCGFETNINYTSSKRTISQIEWIVDGEKTTKSTQSSAALSAAHNTITLDANDTIEAVSSAVSMLGYDLSDEDIHKVYEEFCKVAHKKKVGAVELDAIVANVALQVPPTYKLVSYVINSGNLMPSSAQITLERDSEQICGVQIGDGPIDAAFKTAEALIGRHFELDDFQIQSITEGKEAMGSALVKLSCNGKLYSGKGISTDIIAASIRAYLNAVNKIVYEEA